MHENKELIVSFSLINQIVCSKMRLLLNDTAILGTYTFKIINNVTSS